MTLSPQWLDELRSRTTLSALIGRSTKITKAGREYKACCPFHNEKTPSFTINDEKGFYHCFGCSAHGDAIRWMTDQRGLSFMDAIKELAAEAGMEVPAADPRAAKKAEQASGLHDAMAAAQSYFIEQLQGIDGTLARDYLTQRGIKSSTITQFGFGFAPDSKTSLRAALKHFGDDMLVTAGLLIKVDDKEPYDRFRGRLMIPIRDPRGRVIAFGGRILGAGEPKYLNSPDTPLFDKGRTLYNLDLASPASRTSKQVIVVEGYMDAIALAQAGFGESVAPLGTALTEQQIMMLWRMVNKPVLCFDGDNAGQKAALRAALRALPLLKPGYSLQFATLPQGQDPDDIVRTGGARAFSSELAKAKSLVETLWASEVAAEPLATPEDRAGLKQRLGVHLANIADGEIRRHYADDFRERFDQLFASKPKQENPLHGQKRRNWSPPNPRPSAEAKAIGRVGPELLILQILATLMEYPSLAATQREALIELSPRDAFQADLLGAIISAENGKEMLDREHLPTILGQDVYNRAREMFRGGVKPFGSQHFAGSKQGKIDRGTGLSPEIAKEFVEALRLLKLRPALEAALAKATQRAADDLTEENYAEQQRLRQEKEAFDRRVAELVQRELGEN